MSDTPEPIRRRFLDWFLRSSAGAVFLSVFYPIARFVTPPSVPEATTTEIDAGPANDPDLMEKGFKIVRFGAEPVIVIRLANGEFHALSATCTHLQCIVEYRKPLGVVWCNCHNGQFDPNGRNIAGPPPRPLTPFTVHVVTRSPSDPGTLVLSSA